MFSLHLLVQKWFNEMRERQTQRVPVAARGENTTVEDTTVGDTTEDTKDTTEENTM